MKHDDFMFFETFKDDIDNYRKVYGEEKAEKLLLDIIYYGVTGERKTKPEEVEAIHNILLTHSIQLHIDKSKERYNRAIKEKEQHPYKKRYLFKRKSRPPRKLD